MSSSDDESYDGAGISRSKRIVPPANYLFKIKSYSSLVETKLKMVESNYFKVGGYKWKLILYPSGNLKGNGKGYVSLYLAIANPKNFTGDWEINVNFKLFVFNKKKNNYLTIQDADGAVRKFHEMKTEWGFDQLISLKDLKHESKGYIDNDTCVFGAEVLVIGHSGKWESLAIVKHPPHSTLTWKIENFSKLDKHFYLSKSILVGGREWKLKLFPKGTKEDGVRGKYLSLFLKLTDCDKFPSIRTVYASSKLKILDQLNENDYVEKGNTKPDSFNAPGDEWGYDEFISLSELNEARKGYIKDNVIIIELQIYNISIVKISS